MHTISKHAKERYAERIMGIDNVSDINRYVIENEEKITNDINKMIEYGENIFCGKQKREGKTSDISVFVKDLWVVLADTNKKHVITLYKVDLGLDDDFNKEYVRKMLDKLNIEKKSRDELNERLSSESDRYIEMINENISQINEYKAYIKNLEELNLSYKSIVQNNSVHKNIADKNVIKVVNDLIGKKEF